MFRFTSVTVNGDIEHDDSQYTEKGHSTYPGTMGDHGLWEMGGGGGGRRRGWKEERMEGGRGWKEERRMEGGEDGRRERMEGGEDGRRERMEGEDGRRERMEGGEDGRRRGYSSSIKGDLVTISHAARDQSCCLLPELWHKFLPISVETQEK